VAEAERDAERSSTTLAKGAANRADLTECLGSRPEGLGRRLEWEGAVDALERHRQRLGVRDPERALRHELRTAREHAAWRAAERGFAARQFRNSNNHGTGIESLKSSSARA
jgi:hypothetical protein